MFPAPAGGFLASVPPGKSKEGQHLNWAWSEVWASSAQECKQGPFRQGQSCELQPRGVKAPVRTCIRVCEPQSWRPGRRGPLPWVKGFGLIPSLLQGLVSVFLLPHQYNMNHSISLWNALQLIEKQDSLVITPWRLRVRKFWMGSFWILNLDIGPFT